jgi:hypothetical protein
VGGGLPGRGPGPARTEDRPRLIEVFRLSDSRITELEWREYTERLSAQRGAGARGAPDPLDAHPTRAAVRAKRRAAAALVASSATRDAEVDKALERKEEQVLRALAAFPNVAHLIRRLQGDIGALAGELAGVRGGDAGAEAAKRRLARKIESKRKIVRAAEAEAEARSARAAARARERLEKQRGMSSLAGVVNATFAARNAKRMAAAADDERAEVAGTRVVTQEQALEDLGYLRARTVTENLFVVDEGAAAGAGEGAASPSAPAPAAAAAAAAAAAEEEEEEEEEEEGGGGGGGGGGGARKAHAAPHAAKAPPLAAAPAAKPAGGISLAEFRARKAAASATGAA